MFPGPLYALSREEELAFCCEVSARTGIVLDPVYSGKAMFGLFWEFQALSGRYKGFTNQVDAFSQFVEDTEKVTFHAEEIYVRTIKESASGDDDSGGDEAKGKNNER